jgi:hypothetical protein
MKSLLSFLFFSNEKWRGTTRISRKSWSYRGKEKDDKHGY